MSSSQSYFSQRGQNSPAAAERPTLQSQVCMVSKSVSHLSGVVKGGAQRKRSLTGGRKLILKEGLLVGLGADDTVPISNSNLR